ncbi:MAG: hypothetical protein PHE09_21185 [Oscillospiraceae bacterium]|nr:hypothetical protein [Oscillospiraceae bacterium]
MKVEYVQNLDDEDIRRVCAGALADIESKFNAAKDRQDTKAMRWYEREFADVANFQRHYLGILFRRDDGMVWDGPSDHDIELIEGYDKTLAELNGAEICPFCGSLLDNPQEPTP